MHTLPEQWRPVPGCEGRYEASDHGRVRSTERLIHYTDGRVHPHPSLMLAARPDEDGYLKVQISGGNRKRRVFVHKLVALAFLGPIPDGHDVDHINRERADNRAVNLRYLPISVNRGQADRRGRRNANAKLTPAQVLQIAAMRNRTDQSIADEFGVGPHAIADIRTGKNWSHLTGVTKRRWPAHRSTN